MTKTVLVLGSAPDALNARDFDGSLFDAIVTINNAWQIREDWTHLIHADDFPDYRKPVASTGQGLISYESYVPANNTFGGIVYAGGTMAFSAAYWALHALKPDILAFCGCDMVYGQSDGKSHFYGKGEADPLRKDPTLQSLEAKSNRLMLLALQENCLCTNLSDLPESRLTFPRGLIDDLGEPASEFMHAQIEALSADINTHSKARALNLEQEVGCVVPSGDYWLHMDKVLPEKLAEIDAAWLESYNTWIEQGDTAKRLGLTSKQRDFA
ncbi:MAG: hypothetical protein AB8B94_14760 [Hyphomicrobiales bacterium]